MNSLVYNIVKLHKTINKELKVSKCKIHDFFYCPYHPKYGNKKYRKDSYLRKPNPGMIVKAVKKWNVDIGKSLMIGDSNSDLIAAKRSNLRFVKKKYNELNKMDNTDVIIIREVYKDFKQLRKYAIFAKDYFYEASDLEEEKVSDTKSAISDMKRAIKQMDDIFIPSIQEIARSSGIELD